MKSASERPYANPEAAARKLVELAAGVEPVNGRIHIEKVNYPFMSGCKGTGPEFGAGIICGRKGLARAARERHLRTDAAQSADLVPRQ